MNSTRTKSSCWVRRIANAFVVLLLTAATLTVALRAASRVSGARIDAVAMLPKAPAEWQIQELEIGANEQIMKAVNELLNYDSAVFRRYTAANGRSFEIYLAYWSPAKQPPRLVAAHTPDICWVVNGWKLLDNTTRPAPLAAALAPIRGQFRVFEYSGQPMAVLFWQMVGGEEANYTTVRENAHNRSFLSEIRSRGLFAPAQSQLFIRVSVEKSWAGWESDQEFLKFIAALGRLRPSV